MLTYGVNDNRCLLWEFNLNKVWPENKLNFNNDELFFIDFDLKNINPVNILNFDEE